MAGIESEVWAERHAGQSPSGSAFTTRTRSYGDQCKNAPDVARAGAFSTPPTLPPPSLARLFYFDSARTRASLLHAAVPSSAAFFSSFAERWRRYFARSSSYTVQTQNLHCGELWQQSSAPGRTGATIGFSRHAQKRRAQTEQMGGGGARSSCLPTRSPSGLEGPPSPVHPLSSRGMGDRGRSCFARRRRRAASKGAALAAREERRASSRERCPRASARTSPATRRIPHWLRWEGQISSSPSCRPS